MTTRFKIGDHVSWNSEAGRVSGTIIAVHTRDFDYKGHTHRASATIRSTTSKATRPATSPRIRVGRCGGSPVEVPQVT